LKSKITNVWWEVVGDSSGRETSQLSIQCTNPIGSEVKENRDGFEILVPCPSNMPSGSLYVADGLIRELCVEEEKNQATSIKALLDFPVKPRVETVPGMPFKTVVSLDRARIRNVFQGRSVVVDPGHGGNDFGQPGPVNLLEKHVALLVGQDLEEVLHQRGSAVLMTRIDDVEVSAEERLALPGIRKAHAYIGLHTRAHTDPDNDGFRILFNSSFPDSERLAHLIQGEITKKLKLHPRGISKGENLSRIGSLPAVSVEFVTITNWVEEGLLRSPVFRYRMAVCLANGLTGYFSGKGAAAGAQQAPGARMVFRPQRGVDSQWRRESSHLELISSPRKTT